MHSISRRQVWKDVWSAAMEPTLKKGNNLVVDRFYYASNSIERWDIVIIAVNYEQIDFLPRSVTVSIPPKFGRTPTVSGPPNFCYVKRVVGLPNEKIELRNKRFLINDIEHDYPGDILPLYDGHFPKPHIHSVSTDHVFLVSDNLGIGVDSRHFGTIPTEFIIGKVVS
jgi:signal peptidase I